MVRLQSYRFSFIHIPKNENQIFSLLPFGFLHCFFCLNGVETNCKNASVLGIRLMNGYGN